MYDITTPCDYEGLNGYNSMRSVAGTLENDLNTRYFMRSLYQRAIAGTKFKLPTEWVIFKRYFKNVLYSLGYIGVIDSSEYGKIPQICGFSGYGLALQPVKMLVNQPLVQFEGTIGENCELIQLCGDYMGIWDIVEHYAIRLSTAITSFDCSLINERLSMIALAKNKSAAESLKYLYERIGAGEPFSVADKAIKGEGIDGKDDPIWTFSQDVASQYISDKLLADMETILQQFDREIGIAAVGEKKERLITDEVRLQQADTCARSDTWFESLSDSFDRVNKLFPELGLSFTMNYGGEAHEYERKINANRTN